MIFFNFQEEYSHPQSLSFLECQPVGGVSSAPLGFLASVFDSAWKTLHFEFKNRIHQGKIFENFDSYTRIRFMCSKSKVFHLQITYILVRTKSKLQDSFHLFVILCVSVKCVFLAFLNYPRHFQQIQMIIFFYKICKDKIA